MWISVLYCSNPWNVNMALSDLKYSDNQKTVELEYESFVETIQRAVIVEYNHEYGNADISFHY